MKRIIALILAILLLCCLFGCKKESKILSMTVKTVPYITTYPVGSDGTLRLEGGEVRMQAEDGTVTVVPMTDFKPEQIITDADFSKPGQYIVTIVQYGEVATFFTINVVETVTE